MGKQIQEMKGMIGLEIHTYLVTKEKLFCNCKASREKGQKKNIYICPICTGQPGAKPMLPNEEAVKHAVRIGLMLGCKINKELPWKRKHYSWPDMPKGYQNTLSGARAIPLGENGEFFGIGIWSMHLEEDPASWDPKSGKVDYNRSGLPLVEIVTAPEFTSSGQVMVWLKRLLHSLAYLKAVDPNAGIKVDVNVNLQPPAGSRSPATERVEIKNVSSIEDIGRAIEYELARQKEEGSVRETRRFDSNKGETMRMRGKEDAEDYRFISDPDLQDIILNDRIVKDLEKSLPESPEEKLEKMIKKYKIGKDDAEVLTKHLDIAEFFEGLIGKGIDGKFALPWVTVELLRFLNYNKKTLGELEIKVEDFVELLRAVKNGKISVLKGKQILNEFYPKSFSIAGKLKSEGKIDDESELKKVCEKVISENKKAVEDYKKGEGKALNFLLGMVMKETNRRADFGVSRKVLEKLLRC